jgi:ATP-binding cassette subfamily F protein uup
MMCSTSSTERRGVAGAGMPVGTAPKRTIVCGNAEVPNSSRSRLRAAAEANAWLMMQLAGRFRCASISMLIVASPARSRLTVSSAAADRAEWLHSVNLEIRADSKIGVIGSHAGAGQATLLAVVAGRLTPNSGRITRRDGLASASCFRSPKLPPGRTIGEILATLSPASPATARTIADALSCPPSSTPTEVLDDAQRHRLALTIALSTPADLLVLENPTRHLDIFAAQWLGQHLRHRAGAVLVATHDRYLLDDAADTIVEVDRSHVQEYRGNYLS